ncbi:polyphosphate kinase 1 [Anaerolineales bacterium HSG6]|nr:polyphosphate kinase 1 [Anaerolineales bacterium HSG6]MDM8530568.1 polyphosphate kinase 1 [Anaerolineales bacterium HSG25]
MSNTTSENAQQYDLDDPALFINRELSLLEFNRRVLDEAQDEKNPLLERAKFLAIFSSNMDELFMIRVAGLKQQVTVGITKTPADGLTPKEQLLAIRKKVRTNLVDMYNCFQELRQKLNETGIHLHSYEELTKVQKQTVDDYFKNDVFPILTPLASDLGRPFPHISNLIINLAVSVRDPETGAESFARLKLPGTLPRLVPIKPRQGDSHRTYRFIWLEDLIANNLDNLFPGFEIIEVHHFRITRNADMEIEADEASDLMDAIEATVRRRHYGFVVRLTVTATMPEHTRQLLCRNFNVGPEDIYESEATLGLSGLMALMKLDRPDLKDKPHQSAIHPRLSKIQHPQDIFNVIRDGDILLHHPYDSFVPVADFLKSAARDPDVLAVKQTLYRAGQNSPVVDALMEARENGKQVTALVELKARFDEESNIGWAKTLERAGVHVLYGFRSLKTHTKICLIIRREPEGIRRYVHLSTGNYNAMTAKIYTDMGLFTCNPDIGSDASDLFNALTGYSKKEDYKKFLVAPLSLRKRFIALIEREIAWAREGKPAKLIFKMNALIDSKFIKQIYKASQAGVTVEVIARSICGLRPGIPELSDNVRVISIVGRFLEHTRIYYFHNGGDPEIYLGSADIMSRNLDRRIETLFPIEDPILKEELITALNISWADNIHARQLRADGSYIRLSPKDGEEIRDSQQEFMDIVKNR